MSNYTFQERQHYGMHDSYVTVLCKQAGQTNMDRSAHSGHRTLNETV